MDSQGMTRNAADFWSVLAGQDGILAAHKSEKNWERIEVFHSPTVSHTTGGVVVKYRTRGA